MCLDNIKNIEAKWSATNETTVDITFDVADASHIVAYEVYSISDAGERKRRRFSINSPSVKVLLTMEDLTRHTGYQFEIQAQYDDETFSTVIKSNYVTDIDPPSSQSKSGKYGH